MRKNVSIQQLMTPAAELETVHVEQPLSKVRQLLADTTVHHVPVVSGDKIIGLISATDMLKMTFTAYGGDERSFDAYLDHEFTIDGVMTKSLITLNKDQSVRDAAELLAEGTFHSLPVVDEEGKLVGMVTSTDLIKHLRELYD